MNRKLAEARIEHRAWYDAMTGLPNARLFLRRLAVAVREAGPKRKPLAVLALDLDGFAAINESLGFAAGDELLRRLAPRLMRAVGPRDTVCRAGADEFFVLLTEAWDEDFACRAASRMMVALSRPLSVSGKTVCVTPSVGIAHFPDHARDERVLLARATAALGEAKLEGPASMRVFGEAEALRESA